MQFEWDMDADALYVRLSPESIERQHGRAPLIADLAEDGSVVGVEILFPVMVGAVRKFVDSVGLPSSFNDSILPALVSGNLHALGKLRGGQSATRGDEQSLIELVPVAS